MFGTSTKKWLKRLCTVGFSILLVSAVGLLGDGSGVAMAQGQGGGRGGRGPGFGGPSGGRYASAITSREVDLMDSRLGISDDQRPIVEASFESFSKNFKDASDAARTKLQAAIDDMRSSGDFSNMRETMQTQTQAWKEQSTKLENGFFDEVKSVLTKDQLAKWPLYERDYRRRKDLDASRSFFALSGEDVDMYNLVDTIKPTQEELDKLKPVLDMYSAELDPILIQREQATDTYDAAMAAMQPGGSIDDAQHKLDALVKIRVQLRDLNTRYADSLSQYLAPDRGVLLKKNFQEEAFRNIYRPTAVDDYLKKVEGMSSVTENQKTQISTIEADYTNRVNDVNRQLADLQRKDEVDRQSQFLQRMANFQQNRGQQRGNFGGGRSGGNQQANSDDPRTKLEQQKRDLVESTLTNIFNALTPDQQQAAPKPAADTGRGRGFGGGFGGQGGPGRNRRGGGGGGNNNGG